MANFSLGRYAVLMLAVPLLLQLGGCPKSPSDFMASAKASIQAKDSAAALLHLKNAIAKEPNNAEARVLIGEVLLTTRDPAAAVIELKRARELKIDDNRAVPLLAEAMHLMGSDRQLIDQFGAIKLTLPAAAAELASTLALAHVEMKRPEKAREVVDTALKRAPASVPLRLTSARVKVMEGQPGEAMNMVNELLKDAPDIDDAWAFKGVLHQSAAEPDKALAAYERAIQINPKQLEALYSVTLIQMTREDFKSAREALMRLAKAWPRSLNTLYLEARLNYLEGKYAVARPQFAALLNQAPENVPTLIAAGVNELKLAAPIQAEAQLARAVSLAPTERTARYYLAQAQLQLNRPDKATAALSPLLEGADVTAGVLVLAAQAKLLQGDAAGADGLFTRAAKQKPTDAGVRTALAVARMSKQTDVEGALRELQQISEATTSTEADYRVISARLARRELKEALAAIARLEQKAPQNPSGPELRGQALKMMDDLPGARKAFEEALQRDKSYAPALAQLTALDVKAGKPEVARQRLVTLLASDRNNSQALTMLASLSAQTGAPSAEVLELLERATTADPLNLNAWMTLLMRHFYAGDFQAAVLAAQSANKSIPDNLPLMDLTGRIQLAAGSTNQANSTYADMIKVAPRSPAGYMGLAATLLGANDTESAAKVIQRLVALDPSYVAAQRMAADIALRRRLYGEAMTIARNLQRLHPEEATGYMLEAQTELAQSRRPAAIAALRVSVKKRNPDAAPVRLHDELMRGGDRNGAAEFAQDWMKLHPKDYEFLSYLGDVELETKSWGAAASLYARALQIEPNYVAALNNGALALLQTDSAKALEYAQRAQVIQPNRAEVLDTLAQVHIRKKEYPKAIALLRQAIARVPDPSSLQLSLAEVYIASGDSASAKAELQSVVDRGKTHPKYLAARKLLAAVRSR